MYDIEEGVALPYDLNFSRNTLTLKETGKKIPVYTAYSYLGHAENPGDIFALSFIVWKRPKTYKLAIQALTVFTTSKPDTFEGTTVPVKKVFKTFREAVIYAQAVAATTRTHNIRCQNEDLQAENLKFKQQFQKFNLLLPKK